MSWLTKSRAFGLRISGAAFATAGPRGRSLADPDVVPRVPLLPRLCVNATKYCHFSFLFARVLRIEKAITLISALAMPAVASSGKLDVGKRDLFETLLDAGAVVMKSELRNACQAKRDYSSRLDRNSTLT